MLHLVARTWWAFAIRGIAAIIFGVLALISPEPTLRFIVALFGAYSFVDGISLLVALARGEPEARSHALTVTIMGVTGVIVGVATFVWPNITAQTLLYIVAFWSIFLGVLQIGAAIRLRREIEGELWMAIGGILSVAFGLYLIVNPGSGMLSLVWLTGIWAIVFGISSLALALRVRGAARSIEAATSTVKEASAAS